MSDFNIQRSQSLRQLPTSAPVDQPRRSQQLPQRSLPQGPRIGLNRTNSAPQLTGPSVNQLVNDAIDNAPPEQLQNRFQRMPRLQRQESLVRVDAPPEAPPLQQQQEGRGPVDVPQQIENPPPQVQQQGPRGRFTDVLQNLSQRAIGQIQNTFTPLNTGVQPTGTALEVTSFTQKIDPFGQLSAPPGTTDCALAKYRQLPDTQCQNFLNSVSLTGQDGMRAQPPSENQLDQDLQQPNTTQNGIPRLQHSIWVGGPLKPAQEKHRNFMDQLVQNKQNNPSWDVCLWTDQSREAFANAPDDSDLGRMRQWAIDNDIRLIPVDEVFSGDNAMQLETFYKTEQIKGGTGRAAASDIMRLEIINRFGGLYIDGDKPYNKPFDTIAQKTGTDGEGFMAVREGSNFQNCGMCSAPGNDITQSILDQMQANYGKPRQELLQDAGQGTSVRPTRMEVIIRTGPSLIRDMTLQSEGLDRRHQTDSKHLMPQDFMQASSGGKTNSWDISTMPSPGDRDIPQMMQDGEDVQPLNQVQAQTQQRLLAIRQQSQQPLPDVDLTPQQEQALMQAVEKGVTALVYGVWNNNGLLNLQLAEQHIQNCPNPDLAREMVLKVLGSDAMQDVASQVTGLQLPGSLPTRDSAGVPVVLPESTLDTLFQSDPPLFPNLEVGKFTLQHGAFLGNLQILDYAERKGLLDLSSSNDTHRVEMGQAKRNANIKAGMDVSVFKAALSSGHPETVAFLVSQPAFKNWMIADLQANGDNSSLMEAAKIGQIDTVLWCLQAISPEGLAQVNPAQILNHLYSAQPSNGQNLGDSERAYIFSQFAGNYQASTGQALPVGNPELVSQLSDAYRFGRTELATAMQTQGVQLNGLSGQQKQDLVNGLLTFNRLLNSDDHSQLSQRMVNQQGLHTELMNNRAAQFSNVEQIKNDHGQIVRLGNPQEVLDHLGKAMAYANEHIAQNHSGKKSRVNAWQQSISGIVNHYGAIGRSQRTPAQEMLLQSATVALQRLQQVRT